MVRQHHQLSGREFEHILGHRGGQRSLLCCSPWGHKELDMTQQLNNNNKDAALQVLGNENERESVSRSVMSDSLQPHGLQPARLLCPWDFPGKNTGVGCHFFLYGIFPTQGLNPGLPHCGQTLYHLSHQESPGYFLKRNVKSLCDYF